MPERHRLQIEPLNRETFRPYGDVIEAVDAAHRIDINRGDATRYHDLAAIDVTAEGGRPLVSIFRARPHTLPFRLSRVERHPFGTQTFMPLGAFPYLVVVAMPGPAPLPSQLRCFRAEPGQGVNYRRGAWHHPLLALQSTSDFLVIDRGGPTPTDDCEEFPLDETDIWVEQP